MKHTLPLFICVIFFSVCNAQNTGPQATKDPTVYKGVTDSTCAAEIAFGSYGSGIDGMALEKVEKLITDNKLKFTSKHIGREGEIRICLPLTEAKGKKRKRLINEFKKIAKEGRLVSISIR